MVHSRCRIDALMERHTRSSRRRELLIASLSAGLGFAGCAATPAARDDTAATIATLTRQAAAWDAAIVRKDLAAIAANMSDDFRQIGPRGEVEDRASFLRDLMAPELEIDPYSVEDFEVRLYGDTALLSGRTRMSGRYGGARFSTHYRYIDVYVRTGGTWRVCSVQTTRVVD